MTSIRRFIIFFQLALIFLWTAASVFLNFQDKLFQHLQGSKRLMHFALVSISFGMVMLWNDDPPLIGKLLEKMLIQLRIEPKILEQLSSILQ